MEIFTETLTFFSSVALLALASQLVIKNAAKLARITGLGEVVIGFILLSVSTSMPEISVAIFSVLTKNVGISIGDLFGANVINICLIIALGILVSKKPVKIKKEEITNLSLLLFFASLIPLILIFIGEVGFLVGILLLAFFFGFCLFSIKRRIGLREKNEKKDDIAKPLIWLLFGLFFLVYSAMFVVNSASVISKLTGISQSVIGASIVALSTTLPELSVCLTAIKEGHPHLTLGDTIGSCVTNITLILGLVLILTEFRVSVAAFSTIALFASFSALTLWYFMKNRLLTRKEGLFLLLIFFVYMLSIYGVVTLERMFFLG
ncbi:MAG: sodium:calcium antiporter [Candidatus Aenigmatarchaeota archaeon]